MKKVYSIIKRIGNIFSDDRGMTLLEIMIVIVIIGIFFAVAGPKILSLPQKGNVSAAKTQIANFTTALGTYYTDNGNYPTTDQGLQSLIEKPSSDPAPMNYSEGGYLDKKKLPKDPWGHDYIFTSPAEDGSDFEIICLGRDGERGR